jgi:hypothetical protein
MAAPAYVASFFQSRISKVIVWAEPKVAANCIALINKGLLPEDHVALENILYSPSFISKIHSSYVRALYPSPSLRSGAFPDECLSVSALRRLSLATPNKYFLNQEALGTPEVQMVCRFHLGRPVFPSKVPTCALCQGFLDPMGIHGAVCTPGGGPIRHHNRIRDFLASEFKRVSSTFAWDGGSL